MRREEKIIMAFQSYAFHSADADNAERARTARCGRREAYYYNKENFQERKREG